jgi:hypothetical protein
LINNLIQRVVEYSSVFANNNYSAEKLRLIVLNQNQCMLGKAVNQGVTGSNPAGELRAGLKKHKNESKPRHSQYGRGFSF